MLELCLSAQIGLQDLLILIITTYVHSKKLFDFSKITTFLFCYNFTSALKGVGNILNP